MPCLSFQVHETYPMCAVLLGSEGFTWLEHPCAMMHAFICEKGIINGIKSKYDAIKRHFQCKQFWYENDIFLVHLVLKIFISFDFVFLKQSFAVGPCDSSESIEISLSTDTRCLTVHHSFVGWYEAMDMCHQNHQRLAILR